MKCLIVEFVAAAMVLIGVQQAAGDTVTYAESELITSPGQIFDWIEEVDTSVGIGELIVEAAGDFDYSGSESSSVYLDDIFSAEGLGLGNADVVQERTPDGHYWKKTFALSSTTMSLLTSDNAIAVQIANTAAVHPIYDSGYVSWSLTYNNAEVVPAPSALVGLIGIALAGLLLNGRRRRTA